MLGFKPNQKIWARVNQAILNESSAEVLVTLIGGMSSILVAAGVAATEQQARVHLAAMLLSPDTDGAAPGSLLPQLQAEFAKLNDGKWIQ